MKTKFIPLIVLFVGFIILFSCEQEESNVGNQGNPSNSANNNQPPIANAGVDHTIILPGNTVDLNGSFSTDPDNNIKGYSWTKISGPSSFNITNLIAAQTRVTNLIEGVYQFELKVTDTRELFDTDTVRVKVMPVQEINGNVFFYFKDPTGGLNDVVIESFSPRLVLVSVKIANYPEAGIEGVWSKNRTPICPIVSNYVDLTAFGRFNLPPGTYDWTAESVDTNLNGYPIASDFKQYWEAGTHKAQGTVTVQEGDNCIIKEIFF